MPKAPPRNAFFFFMCDHRDRAQANGRKFPNGMQDVAKEAAPIWQDLNPAIRATYEKKARDAKEKRKNDLTQKFTPNGESFAQVKKMQEEEKQREDDEKLEVKHMIALKSLNNSRAILDQSFYVMDVNYFCKAGDIYVPCEIGLVEFNLRNGIINHYHTLIDPEGGIPLGYQSTAKDSFNEHNIPVPPVENGEGDYLKLLTQLYVYLDFTAEVGEVLPPIFTMPNKVECVESVLRQLSETLGPESEAFRVYKLDYMFYILKNAIKKCDRDGFPKESLAHVALEKSDFEYTPGIACDFHDDTDVSNHCVMARIKNWTYIILDHCCQLVNVPLEPGKHVPAKTNLQGTAVLQELNNQKPQGYDGKYNQLEPKKERSQKYSRPRSEKYCLPRSEREPEGSVQPKVMVGKGRGKSTSNSFANLPIGE